MLVRCNLLFYTRWFYHLSLSKKSQSVIIQMKATKQYVPVVQSAVLYKVVLSFESVDEILKCDHSNESYPAICSCGTICYSNFCVCE